MALAAVAMALLAGAAPTCDLTIDIARLRSTNGMIRLCLTAEPDNFPSCADESRAVTPLGPGRCPRVAHSTACRMATMRSR